MCRKSFVSTMDARGVGATFMRRTLRKIGRRDFQSHSPLRIITHFVAWYFFFGQKKYVNQITVLVDHVAYLYVVLILFTPFHFNDHILFHFRFLQTARSRDDGRRSQLSVTVTSSHRCPILRQLMGNRIHCSHVRAILRYFPNNLPIPRNKSHPFSAKHKYFRKGAISLMWDYRFEFMSGDQNWE